MSAKHYDQLRTTKLQNRLQSHLVQLDVRRRLCDPFRCSPALQRPSPTRTSWAASEKHTAHHVQQWVSLFRDSNTEIQFPDLCQHIVPYANFLDVRRIVRGELSEKIRAPALDCKEQHAYEVQQGYCWKNSDVRTRAAHFLCAERGVRER